MTRGKAFTALDIRDAEGCFAGITLAVGLNGNNTCFVEGEPKIYIDGDVYPTINYTGTEDYFGGAYGFGNDIEQHQYQTFFRAVSGTVCNSGGQPGTVQSAAEILILSFPSDRSDLVPSFVPYDL